MSTYLYELPTTGAISFADVCLDEHTEYITEIAETTEARANLRAVLKLNKRTDDDEKDFLKLVKTLDEYLPRLCGILSCVEHGELALKSEPVFSWRTTLSATMFHNSPRIALPTLSADLCFTLLTNGFALSNMARAVVRSLGTYETERAILDAERKEKDERLGFAVNLLCRAAGVFEYVGKECLGEWERERARVVAAGMSCTKPPDLSKEVVIALSKMALADAQTLAIRKLLSRAAFDSTLNPGPPLPASHPSPALVAKLHLECAALYSSARSLAKTPDASASTRAKLKGVLGRDKGQDRDSEEPTEVAPELRHYLADAAAFHEALAWKWLGVDAGENGGTSKGGIAVGFLAGAKKELEELKSSGRVMGSDREKEMRERRREKVVQELESVNVFLSGYKKLNDTVSFQPVPPQSELQASIPAGRLAVTIKPYTRPAPAFGPGSASYIQRHTEALELKELQEALKSEDNSHEQIASPRSGNSYAGAGAYF